MSHENSLQIGKYGMHVFWSTQSFKFNYEKELFNHLLLCGFIYKKNQCENAYIGFINK